MDFKNMILTEEAEEVLQDLEKKYCSDWKMQVTLSEHTPEALLMAGLEDKPLVMPIMKMIVGLSQSKHRDHGHSGDYSSIRLGKALRQLGRPVAVVKDDDSYGVYVETLSNTSRPMFICIKSMEEVNVVVSVYSGRRIKADKDEVLYIDKARINGVWKDSVAETARIKAFLQDVLLQQERASVR